MNTLLIVEPRPNTRPLPRLAQVKSSTSRHEPLPRWKRLLDLTCITLALPAVLSLMAVIAVVIRLGSRGPIIFRQERIGLRGRPFICLKFRTMKADAATRAHEAHFNTLIRSNAPMQKLDAAGDARIVRGGGWLRATGLDELPQLINVLRGEMSLIGPRPCLRYEYEQLRPPDRLRFEALPGLTGLWQVSGKNRTSFQQMIALDIEYARNLSLGGDLRILFRTVPLLIDQAGEFARRRTGSKAKAPRPGHG